MDNKREQMMPYSRTFSALAKYQRHEQDYSSGVLDLSRPAHRRDSVETRKTPSPSNGSSFSSNEGSPTISHSSSNIISIHGNLLQRHEQYSPKSDSYESTYSPRPIKRESPPVPQTAPELVQPFPGFAFNCSSTSTPGGNRNLSSPIITPQAPSAPVHHLEQHHQLSPHSHSVPTNERFLLQHRNNFLNSEQVIPQNDSSNDTSPENFISTSTGGSNQKNGAYPMVVGRDGKLSRPFKAYPHDPLSIAASFTATDTLIDSQSAEKYNSFRKRMLEQIHAANGGQPTVSNPKMRRTPSKSCDPATNRFTESPLINNNDITTTNNNNHSSDSSSSSCHNSNGGSLVKDTAYFERRKKNNAAAKKSRDRRRIKEDEIAIRAAFLERENIELKFELAAARKQLSMYGVSMA